MLNLNKTALPIFLIENNANISLKYEDLALNYLFIYLFYYLKIKNYISELYGCGPNMYNFIIKLITIVNILVISSPFSLIQEK